MTPEEEYDYLREQLRSIPDFIPVLEHPNKLRAANMRAEKINNKLSTLVDTPEFREYITDTQVFHVCFSL